MSNARALLFAGLCQFDFYNPITRAFQGFYGVSIDVDKLAIKPNFEEKTSESRSHLDYGQARAAVLLPKPTEISVDLSASSTQLIAMQFQGLVASMTQSAGNLVAVDVTVAALGVWLPTGKRNLVEAGFVVTNADATVTYVLGTHFEVNWLIGEIRFLPAAVGAPALSSVVKVTAAYFGVDGTKILGGRVTQVRTRMRLIGKNMVDDEPVEVEVHEAVMGAGNELDFLSADFVPISMNGKIVTPAGKTEGYEVRFPTRSNA